MKKILFLSLFLFTFKIAFSDTSSKKVDFEKLYVVEKINPEMNDTDKTVNIDVFVSQTWYSYQSGNWNDPFTWTLDPAGVLYTNTLSEIPIAGDLVNVLSGRTVTIQSTTNNISIASFDVVGRLDLTTSTGHAFTVISGNGIISTAATTDNFPSGDVSSFSDVSIGGTYIVNGGNITLGTAREFNDVQIDLTNTTDIAILMADYVINGALTIAKGIFQINDNSSTTQLDLTVDDVTIDADGKITVGSGDTSGSYSIPSTMPTIGNYHAVYHSVNINGNFTNNGSARFTNQSFPDYSEFYDGGAASVYFIGGDGNTATLNGVTDFYNLIIDKGTDQTYVFEINSASASNFVLYGPNHASWDDSSPFTTTNPEIRKALWIKNGTLKLTGTVLVPTLTEGDLASGEYLVPSNGALWVAGANVEVITTAITTDTEVGGHTGVTDLETNEESFFMFGELRVSDGVFSTNNSRGVVYNTTAFPEILIEGGTVTVKKFRALGSGGNASYTQSGGIVTLIGGSSTNGNFDFGGTGVIFNMSGGEIILDEGDFLVGATAGNYSVTGGKVTFNMSANNNYINSTANLWDVETKVQSGTRNLHLANDLVVSNDLTLGANTTLNTDATFNYSLSIGADFTISSGGSFTANSNTTTINGTKISNFNFAGLVTFNNLTIAKTDASQLIEIDNGAATAIQVDGAFRLEAGTLDYKSFVVNTKGSLYVADTIGVAAETGKLLLDGASQQSFTSVNGVIANMEIDNSNGIDLQSGDLSIFETLTMTTGVFDINISKLTMAGANATIAGTFSSTLMIQTAGNASDGGLEMYVDANETITFPIGTDANAVVRYTPLVATYSSYAADDGYVQVSTSDTQLPTTDGNGGTILSYYWNVGHTGFTAVPKVSSYVFTHDGSDLDGETQLTNWVPGKVQNSLTPLRLSEDKSNYANGSDIITFDGDGTTFDLENASYTVGKANRFLGPIEVYYSNIASGDFNTTSTWSKDAADGTGQKKIPTEGSIVIIQNGDRINVSGTIPVLGRVVFDHDYVATPTPTSEDVARLQFYAAGTFELGIISGAGMISFDAPDAPIVNGDFGDFGTNEDSYFLYFGGDATLNAIPTPIPNLMVESAIYTIDQTLAVNYDLIIQGDGTLIPLQDIDVTGDLDIGASLGGTFQFPSTGTAVNVTVDGDIDFTIDPFSNPSDRDLEVSDSGNDIEHRLILKGDILHGVENTHSIGLFNASETRPRVILELQGETDNSYTRTSTAVPELYRVVLNKGTTQTNSFTFNDSFTLNGETDDVTKALELQNGTLILNDAAIDIDLTTGGDDFQIPGTSGLQVSLGTVNASGNDSGIWLDGSLIIDGGTVDMDDTGGGNGNNYIEYSASGTATIDISAGALTVGSQIRRNTVASTGVLNYTQTGGTVIVGKNAAPESNRGVFEVLNTGSDMTFTGGSLTLVRQNGTTPGTAALFLAPETSDFTGSTITIGSADTPISQTEFNITALAAFNNITFAGSNTPTSKLKVLGLLVGGNLTINSGHTLDGNSYSLTLAGDFTNNGTYTANGNTTYFSGKGTQAFSGSGSESFYNMVKNDISALTFSKSVAISNDITLGGGSINTGSNTITVQGNAEIDISVSSTSGNGLIFSGSIEQFLTRSKAGASIIDILTVDNSSGVTITSAAAYNFTINNDLRLSSGLLSIGSNLLTISTSASISDANPFSVTNMIQTNSSFTDNGVKKEFNDFPSGTSFTFPVGESVFTPITFTITNMDAGSITARPANEMHISIIEDSESPPDTEIVDADNALQYHWVMQAADIVSMTGSATFTYDATDAAVTFPYTLANYIPARLLDATTSWDKAFSGANFDEGANAFTVGFTGVDNDGIDGVYTAGVGVDNSDVAIKGAIPDIISTYETNTTGGGDYDDVDTWTAASIPAAGPLGGQITVKTGDDLILNNDGVRLSRTLIESGGTLTVDETTFHRLGTVTGTGVLKIVSSTTNANLPAGYYGDFFSCTGGSIEYAGTGNYSIMPSLASVRSLILSGTGDRNLANNDVAICEDLTINGPTFNNANNRTLTITDELILTSGTFNSGTGNVSVVGNMTLNGGTFDNQTGGILDVDGILAINSGTFNAGTGGSVYLRGNVNYTSGTFTGGSSTAAVRFNGASLQTIAGDFTATNSFHRVEMYNDISLSNNIEIDNQLTFSSGVMYANTDTVTLGSAITVSPAEGLSTSYIDGKVLKIITNIGDDFTFPIGKNGRWGHASVKNVSAGGETWDAEYFFASPTTHADVTNITPIAPILTISNNEYWVISDGAATPGVTANIGLSWDGNSDVSPVSGEREQLEVMVWNDGASTWDEYGGGTFSGGHTQSAGSFQSTSLVTFSENIFTLGSTNLLNALPIELLSFEAEALTNTVKLTWETASELNNDFFTVLRSKDGEVFEDLTTVLGAGNSSEVLAYTFIDERPYNGISYYKLMQTDFDGLSSESDIVLVKMLNNSQDLMLVSYPNPFSDEAITLNLSGLNDQEEVSIAVYDMLGKQKFLVSQQANDSGYLDMVIEETRNWDSGIYIIMALTEKGVVQTKVIKQ